MPVDLNTQWTLAYTGSIEARLQYEAWLLRDKFVALTMQNRANYYVIWIYA
jgi:hypothetical protein